MVGNEKGASGSWGGYIYGECCGRGVAGCEVEVPRKVSLPRYGCACIRGFGPPGRALAGGLFMEGGYERPGVETMQHGEGGSTDKEPEL